LNIYSINLFHIASDNVRNIGYLFYDSCHFLTALNKKWLTAFSLLKLVGVIIFL